MLDHQGKAVPLQMGCYGLGVTRVVAAAIEQNHDERGIIWPAPLDAFRRRAPAPQHGASPRSSRPRLRNSIKELQAAGYDVLMDDRDLRPGPMFADVELIGIPHRLVLSERGLDAGTVEYKGRRDAENQNIPAGELMAFLKKRLPPQPPDARTGLGWGLLLAGLLAGSPAHAQKFSTPDPELIALVQQAEDDKRISRTSTTSRSGSRICPCVSRTSCRTRTNA